MDRTDVEIVGAALPAGYHSTSFMKISRRCPRRYPVSPLLAKARGKGSASRRHAVARLWFALWPVGGRCVSVCSAGASLTPGAGAVTASGCLVTRPRHEPCCGCATASTPLASSSWLRFLPSLLLLKGRKETSMWRRAWEPGKRFRRACRPAFPSSDRDAPGRLLFLPLRHKIKPVVLTKLLARHVNDLLDMPAKMRDAVKDGCHDGCVISLNPSRRPQCPRRERPYRRIGSLHRLPQDRKDLPLRPIRSIRKFPRPIPPVICPAHARDNPLPDIAR